MNILGFQIIRAKRPRPVTLAGRLTDANVIERLAIDPDHPILAAVNEILLRKAEDAAYESAQAETVENPQLLAFTCGSASFARDAIADIEDWREAALEATRKQ